MQACFGTVQLRSGAAVEKRPGMKRCIRPMRLIADPYRLLSRFSLSRPRLMWLTGTKQSELSRRRNSIRFTLGETNRSRDCNHVKPYPRCRCRINCIARYRSFQKVPYGRHQKDDLIDRDSMISLVNA